MRQIARFAVVATLLAVIPLASCGGGSGNADGKDVSFGSIYYAIPYLRPIFETEIIGFKNLTGLDTSVEVTPFTTLGALGAPTTVDIPARGETRLPVETFLGTPLLYVGGWLMIDTTGEAEGKISTYIDRSNTLNESSDPGVAFRAGTISQSLTPFAESYQIINASEDAGGTGIGITYDVTTYDAFGALYDTMEVDILPGAAETLPVPFPGFVGMAYIAPKSKILDAFDGTEVLMSTVTCAETESSIMTEARLVEGFDTTRSETVVGYDIDYGFDLGNNFHDFAFICSNTTSKGQVVTIDAINLADGTSIMPQPRQIQLDPHDTKYFRDRTIDSIGRDQAELSPFDDLFLDLDQDPDFARYSFIMTIPSGVNASMRNFDSVFRSYFRVLNSTSRLSTRVSWANIPTQTTTVSGTRNWVDVINPFANTIDVFPTVMTPGGTIYVLDPVSIAPLSRERFSPDGQIFREDPFDPLEPPVPFISLELSSVGGLFYNARKTTRNAQDLILFMRPGIIRNETFE